MSKSKGLVRVATVFFLAIAMVFLAAMFPALSQSLTIGFNNASNPLTKAFMAGLVPAIIFLLIGSAFASEELEKQRSRNRRQLA